MLRFSVWWVGGMRGGGTDGFNNQAHLLKLLQQSISSEPRNYISFPQHVS